MKTELIRVGHPIAIPHAVDILRHGGMVAFPTDTVYGLAALPFQEEIVEQLYAAKGRNSNRAIAVLLGSFDQLDQIAANIGDAAARLAQRFWPGPLTLIVPRLPTLPDALSATPTIGVRIPNHPVALDLLRITGPLAVTSANLSGEPSPTTAAEVMDQLNGRIHLVLDGGATPGGKPSTVVDMTSSEPVILRPGPITLEDLQKELS